MIVQLFDSTIGIFDLNHGATINKQTGAIDGFGYSEVLASNGEIWSYDNLNGFLEKPKDWAPGTKMSFNGLKKPTDRANLIAYLETIGG